MSEFHFEDPDLKNSTLEIGIPSCPVEKDNFVDSQGKQIRTKNRGGTGGGLGGYNPPLEASSPPSGEILGSRRRNFGKITHENTIFQSF